MEIDVLGLGPSLAHYRPRPHITIGVNDIFRHHATDFVVVVDPPGRFTPDRKQTIIQSTPRAFFTSYTDWHGMVQNIRILQLAPGRGRLVELDTPKICFSNNSTFVATVMAYKMGAKKINLFGVDLTTHPSLGRDRMLVVAVHEFTNLGHALAHRGVEIHVAPGGALCGIFPPV